MPHRAHVPRRPPPAHRTGVLADNAKEREAALAELVEPQTQDFVELLTAMDGLPTTIRLLDPPLHEFLPDRADLMVKVALAEERGEADPNDVRLLAAVERLHESNPMLGLRGVRLGLTVPGLFALQVRAVAKAAAQLVKAGGDPRPEIMVPLVGSVMELHLIRDEADAILAEVRESDGVDLHIPIGTMVELPRAALTAFRVAEAADFFSFGTNDLTQTTWGFSRDDVEAAFFAAYLDKGVFTVSPFETLDADGVGRLVDIATREGRSTRPDLKVGVCGEHGGDPGVDPLLPPRPGWTTSPARRSGSRSRGSRPGVRCSRTSSASRERRGPRSAPLLDPSRRSRPRRRAGSRRG